MTAGLLPVAENEMTVSGLPRRRPNLLATKPLAFAVALLIHVLLFLAIDRPTPVLGLTSKSIPGAGLRVTLVSTTPKRAVAQPKRTVSAMEKPRPRPHANPLVTHHPSPRQVYSPITKNATERNVPAQVQPDVAQPANALLAASQSPLPSQSPTSSLNLPAASERGNSAQLVCDIPRPPYPARARRLGHQGTVQLLVKVDSTGRITEANVRKSSGFEELDEAAQQAMLEGHCDPIVRSGVAVETTAVQPLSFNLAN